MCVQAVVCVHTHTNIHTNKHMDTHACMHTQIHTRTYACTHTHTHSHAPTSIYAHHTHARIQARTHTHTRNTLTHTQKYQQQPQQNLSAKATMTTQFVHASSSDPHHNSNNTICSCFQCCSNRSGAKMSELMFLLGENDPRVRVLMTTIKQWAKSCDMTRSHPGPWPANFTLLAMLVFFLQTRSPPVLPSIRHLQALAGQFFFYMV